ncbi:MAG: helix-turn-helix domain-containing protein [Lentilitoribacter sp.]
MKTPYERIFDRLKEMGMKPTTASKLADLDPSYLRELAKNPERQPRGASAEKLAKVLGKSAQWILFGIEDVNEEEIERNFTIDPAILEAALEQTKKVIVFTNSKPSKEDECKMIAFHYEEIFRKLNNIAPLEVRHSSNPSEDPSPE